MHISKKEHCHALKQILVRFHPTIMEIFIELFISDLIKTKNPKTLFHIPVLCISEYSKLTLYISALLGCISSSPDVASMRG